MSNNGILNNLIPAQSEYEDIRKKEDFLYKKKVNAQFKEVTRNDALKSLTDTIDLGLGNTDRLKRIKEENTAYFEDLKDMSVFLNDDFKKDVPFTPRSLTLCMANTGEGKSTASANIAFQCMTQNKNVLMIVNEENANDCYNRITCMIKGWHYQEHDQFTEEQRKIFNDYIDILGSRLTVIDNYGNDGKTVTNQTTSIEGMDSIFTKIIDARGRGIKYDVIIIDYYQNVHMSLENPNLVTWQVQERFGDIIDQFKNVAKCPIVLMAQKKSNKKDDEAESGSYKDLIEGRKSIANKTTCILEVKADKENQRTEWIVKKCRWSSSNGKSIFTGYDKGKFVRYTEEFRKKVQQRKLEVLENKVLQERIRSIANEKN